MHRWLSFSGKLPMLLMSVLSKYSDSVQSEERLRFANFAGSDQISPILQAYQPLLMNRQKQLQSSQYRAYNALVSSETLACKKSLSSSARVNQDVRRISRVFEKSTPLCIRKLREEPFDPEDVRQSFRHFNTCRSIEDVRTVTPSRTAFRLICDHHFHQDQVIREPALSM